MVDRKAIIILTAGLILAATSASAQKVEISTDKKSYTRNEEIKVTVTVTDDDGVPVETNLTCAVYRINKGQKPASGDGDAFERTSYTDILSMIEQKKPFRLVGNRIVFTSAGPNTNNTQDGALLVLNGSALGQDVSTIQYLNPNDVESINISTDYADIQRYTGFNTMGVIEIYTKTGNSGVKKGPPAGKGLPDSQEVPAGGKLIYSNTKLRTDSSGKTNFVFPAWKKASDVVIIIATREPGTNPVSSRLTVEVR